jgi:HlyD family secretion protein
MITLVQKNNPLLRPHSKAAVFVIVSFKEKAIRVKNSPAFDGSVEQEVFVIKGNQAVSRKVVTGESNFSYIEIISGLQPGEEIITSDMAAYKKMEAFTLK